MVQHEGEIKLRMPKRQNVKSRPHADGGGQISQNPAVAHSAQDDRNRRGNEKEKHSFNPSISPSQVPVVEGADHIKMTRRIF